MLHSGENHLSVICIYLEADTTYMHACAGKHIAHI